MRADLDVGAELPELVGGPTTRTVLSLFAGGSGDHAKVHLDIDLAREAGFSDVIVHGMLSMAYLARMLTNAIPQQRLRRWGVRFVSPTPVNSTVVCRAKVVEHIKLDGVDCAKLALTAQVDAGLVTLVGEAIVTLDDEVQKP